MSQIPNNMGPQRLPRPPRIPRNPMPPGLPPGAMLPPAPMAGGPPGPPGPPGLNPLPPPSPPFGMSPGQPGYDAQLHGNNALNMMMNMNVEPSGRFPFGQFPPSLPPAVNQGLQKAGQFIGQNVLPRMPTPQGALPPPPMGGPVGYPNVRTGGQARYPSTPLPPQTLPPDLRGTGTGGMPRLGSPGRPR
jgi:hypothetical protein